MAITLEEQYDKIYRYCYFHVKDQYLAEDLTQETFFRYYRQEGVRIRVQEMAYLYTIARNLCIDHYRKTKEEEKKEKEGEVRPLDNLAEYMDLYEAVGRLQKEQQEILLLKYVDGLRTGELAKVLGISRFSLYRKEKEILELLKKKLEGGV